MNFVTFRVCQGLHLLLLGIIKYVAAQAAPTVTVFAAAAIAPLSNLNESTAPPASRQTTQPLSKMKK